jgi:hypothetical protein
MEWQLDLLDPYKPAAPAPAAPPRRCNVCELLAEPDLSTPHGRFGLRRCPLDKSWEFRGDKGYCSHGKT